MNIYNIFSNTYSNYLRPNIGIKPIVNKVCKVVSSLFPLLIGASLYLFPNWKKPLFTALVIKESIPMAKAVYNFFSIRKKPSNQRPAQEEEVTKILERVESSQIDRIQARNELYFILIELGKRLDKELKNSPEKREKVKELLIELSNQIVEMDNYFANARNPLLDSKESSLVKDYEDNDKGMTESMKIFIQKIHATIQSINTIIVDSSKNSMESFN